MAGKKLTPRQKMFAAIAAVVLGAPALGAAEVSLVAKDVSPKVGALLGLVMLFPIGGIVVCADQARRAREEIAARNEMMTLRDPRQMEFNYGT